MSIYNLCFEQKYEKYQSFLSENFQFLEVNFSIYLNRRVFCNELRFDDNVHICSFCEVIVLTWLIQ